MNTINLGNAAPKKYLRQSEEGFGLDLEIDRVWTPDPAVDYVTTINISPDSTIPQAADEVQRIWAIHGNGKPAWVSGNNPGLVALLAAIYEIETREYIDAN